MGPVAAVSMKSGLGDRNNLDWADKTLEAFGGLNEVRSWRPEQWSYREGRVN